MSMDNQFGSLESSTRNSSFSIASQLSQDQSSASSKPNFDVLKIYDDADVERTSIFTGSLDTGIDLGSFIFDTSNPKNCQRNPSYANYTERFIGPYCRTSLNDDKLISDSEASSQGASETRSAYLLEQYFKLINTQTHGQLGSMVESESLTHEFRLPKCFDMPKFREIAPSMNGQPNQLISAERC